MYKRQGLALVACSNTKTDTTDQNNANQNNTTQNQNNNDTTTDQTADADVKYLEDLGYKDVKAATGTNAHQTYKLNEATAVDQNIYGQWVFTWVEPAEYLSLIHILRTYLRSLFLTLHLEEHFETMN